MGYTALQEHMLRADSCARACMNRCLSQQSGASSGIWASATAHIPYDQVSEENDEPIFIDEAHRGSYCVVVDPLDGSSNIDCGVRCTILKSCAIPGPV